MMGHSIQNHLTRKQPGATRAWALAFVCAWLTVASVQAAPTATPNEAAVTRGAGGEVIATEEKGAIERSLEGKVRDILDGVIKADHYAVYVQVTIKADAAALQAYYDERALTTLPGIPAPDPDLGSPTNNKLHSMIQTRKIIVVLDKLVTADQELVTKEILRAKLALDDKKGDALDIRRAEVPTSLDRQIASTHQVSGTESWVRYFLIGLAVTLGLAIALLLWQVSILRERVDARAKFKADIKVNSSQDLNSNVSGGGMLAAPGQANLNGDADENGERRITNGDPISAVELKEKILALAVSQPKACSLVARRLMSTREGMRKLAVACEAIGFEYTKQLFDTVSPAKWRAMGEYLRQNLSEITRAPLGKILLEIYTEMLAESMGWDPSQNSNGPFDFLHKITEPEMAKLLVSQEPSHIAFIAAYWEPEEMSQILSVLNDARRKETILHIARLNGLPREVVQQAAIRFAERLRVLRARNEVDVDGSQVVARMLDTSDNTNEEDLLRFIEREDPAARDRLRQHYFSFDSISTLPSDIMAVVFTEMDPQLVTQALVGMDDGSVQAVLSVFPPKQRAIIEDDVKIANLQSTFSKAEVSVARKQVILLVRKVLKDRGIELHQLGIGGDGSSQQSSMLDGGHGGHTGPTASTLAADAPMELATSYEAAPLEAVPMDMGELQSVSSTSEVPTAEVAQIDPSSDDQAA